MCMVEGPAIHSARRVQKWSKWFHPTQNHQKFNNFSFFWCITAGNKNINIQKQNNLYEQYWGVLNQKIIMVTSISFVSWHQISSIHTWQSYYLGLRRLNPPHPENHSVNGPRARGRGSCACSFQQPTWEIMKTLQQKQKKSKQTKTRLKTCTQHDHKTTKVSGPRKISPRLVVYQSTWTRNRSPGPVNKRSWVGIQNFQHKIRLTQSWLKGVMLEWNRKIHRKIVHLNYLRWKKQCHFIHFNQSQNSWRAFSFEFQYIQQHSSISFI